MSKLNRGARVYILCTILAGLALLLRGLIHFQMQGAWMLLVVCALACLSLIFKVEGSTNHTHYNISFLVYAFSLLELGLDKTILVIVVSNLAEWAWYRYSWYVPLFNAGSLSLVMALSNLVFSQMVVLLPQTGIARVAAILLSLVVFTLLNHLTVGLVIWFARQENFIQSGVFELFPLLFDFSLMSMGAGAAFVWNLEPFAVILPLIPLYLIYSTSKMPSLERKSETDAKTGVFNATYFNQALENELKRSNRFTRPLSVVMADLDLLRNINNTYGHLAGDEVLIGVANILKDSVREYDIVARFGGEEFVILMPESSAGEVFSHVDTIRKKIEQAEFNVQTSVTPIKVTMSFGIAERAGIDQNARQIIHNADAALYHSKLKGRNRVYIYKDDGYQEMFQAIEQPAGGHVTAAGGVSISAAIAQELPLPVEALAEENHHSTPGDPPAGSMPKSSPAAQKPETRQTRANRKRFSTDQFVGVLLATAMLMFGALMAFNAPFDWIGLTIFAALVGFMEYLSIDIYMRDTSVSTSAAPMLAGFLLFGPVGVFCLSIVLSVVAMVKHRSRLRNFLFNASNQMISGFLCAGFVILTGNSFTHLAPWQQLAASVVAAMGIYITTTCLVSFGMSLDSGASAREIWNEKFSWLALYYLGMGVIAFVLIFCFKTFGPIGVLIVLGPLLILRFGQVQYIDKTRTVVKELKEKNIALRRSAEEISKLNEGLLNALAEVVDLHDPYVLDHSKQVARIAGLLAKKMGLSPRQAQLIHKAGLLHDIGKLGIPDAILSKPGKLSRQEFQIIQSHTTVGAEILKSSNSLHDLIPVVYHHHEHFDGSGYPDGLSGSEVSIEARVVALADAVEAMASDRPYRSGRTLNEIITELARCSGTQFDPQIVTAFIELAHEMGGSLFISSLQEIEAVAEQ